MLRRHREKAGLTQEELAARAGLGPNTIGNLERGVNSSPRRSTLERLSTALELDAEESDALAAAARRRPSEAMAAGGFLGARPTCRLVGREPELERLLGAHGAVERGEGRLLLLAGEAGIGKTRLAQEGSVHAADRGFLVAAGRCYEGRRGVPYFPFLEALDTIAGASEDLARRRPQVAALLSVEGAGVGSIDSEAEALRLLRAITELVKEVAARRPVALLLDDLHWADGASIGLLAHLARHTRTDRVLLLGTYRDAEVPHGHPLRRAIGELDREQLTQRIACGRLGPAATAALVHDLRPEAGAELAARVHRQTDGNPFFVVEVMRGIEGQGEEAPIPAAVRDAILDRVASLAPAARGVLDAGTVLGPAFAFRDLLAVANGHEVDRGLDEVGAIGLLRPAGEGYAFDHALTQQTLYAEIAGARRRRLHLAAADGLDRSRAAEIGRHLVRAGAPELAVPHLLRAGEQAEALYANGEALEHFGEALELAERVGDAEARTDALERLGDTLVTVARYDEGIATLERAVAARTDPAGVARIEARIAQAHFRRGTSAEGAGRLRDRLAELDRPHLDGEARTAVAGLYGALARLCFARLEYERCCEAAGRVAELADDESLRAEAEMINGTALVWLDDPGAGIAALERSIAAAERCGAFDTLSTASLALHRTALLRGDFDRGRRCAAGGGAAATRVGDPQLIAMHSTNLGLQLFYSGDWRGAAARLESAADALKGARSSIFACTPPAYLGVLRKGQGAWEEATSLFEEAAELATEAQIVVISRYAQCRLAEMEVLRGKPRDAIRRLEALGGDLKWMYDVILFTVLADAHADSGDPEEGARLAREALRRAAAMGNLVEAIDADRALARCLRMQGRPEEAGAILVDALARARALPYPYGEAHLLLERAESADLPEAGREGEAILARLRAEVLADPAGEADALTLATRSSAVNSA